MGRGKSQENLGVSDALRKAGFVKLPPWWVLPDELEVIHRIAHKHSSRITAIRLQSRGLGTGEDNGEE